jgi:hypothetical protein
VWIVEVDISISGSNCLVDSKRQGNVDSLLVWGLNELDHWSLEETNERSSKLGPYISVEMFSSWSVSRIFRYISTEMYGPSLLDLSLVSSRDQWSSSLRPQTRRLSTLPCLLLSTRQLLPLMEISTSTIHTWCSMLSLQQLLRFLSILLLLE